VPWQCSLNITYQIVVEDAVSKCPLDSAGPAAAPGAAPMAPPPAIVPRLGEGSQHDVAAAVSDSIDATASTENTATYKRTLMRS
jgi:hypothetical protein